MMPGGGVEPPRPRRSADFEFTGGCCTAIKILYPTPLFNGPQIGQSDPICLEMIGFEYGTTTVLLQWILVAHVSSRTVLVDGKGALSGTRAKASGIILAARAWTA